MNQRLAAGIPKSPQFEDSRALSSRLQLLTSKSPNPWLMDSMILTDFQQVIFSNVKQNIRRFRVTFVVFAHDIVLGGVFVQHQR